MSESRTKRTALATVGEWARYLLDTAWLDARNTITAGCSKVRRPQAVDKRTKFSKTLNLFNISRNIILLLKS